MVKTIAPGHWESITPEAARNGDRIDFLDAETAKRRMGVRRVRRSVYSTGSFSVCSRRRTELPIIYADFLLDYKLATLPLNKRRIRTNPCSYHNTATVSQSMH